jgi:hypothetical protein
VGATRSGVPVRVPRVESLSLIRSRVTHPFSAILRAMAKANWTWVGGLALLALVTNCESSSDDEASAGSTSIGVAGSNDAGAGATPAGGSAGEAGAAGQHVGGSGNASSSPGDGYAGDCGIPGVAGALSTGAEPPPATCYSAGKGTCLPCCPTKPPDCSTLPDQYPGYDCAPAPGKSPDLSYCACRCHDGEWLCAC